MITLAQLKRAAEASGVEVVYWQRRDGDFVSYELEMIAPRGKRFGSRDLHETCITDECLAAGFKRPDFAPELDDIKSLVDCDDPDCEYCHAAD